MNQPVLSIPLYIRQGLTLTSLHSQIKYLLVCLYSFYKYGNTLEAVITTNSKQVKHWIESYVIRTKHPVRVEMVDFEKYFDKGCGDWGGAGTRCFSIIQKLGAHYYHKETPFVHADTDILFLNKIPDPKKESAELTFFTKSWANIAVPVFTGDNYDKLVESFELPDFATFTEGWVNTGIYYSNTDLTEEINELIGVYDHPIHEIVGDNLTDEFLFNVLEWKRKASINNDRERNMNILPSMVDSFEYVKSFGSMETEMGTKVRNSPKRRFSEHAMSLHFHDNERPTHLRLEIDNRNLYRRLLSALISAFGGKFTNPLTPINFREHKRFTKGSVLWFQHLAEVNEIMDNPFELSFTSDEMGRAFENIHA